MDETALRGLAAQLARPSGDAATQLAAAMNGTNRAMTERAIEALAPQPGETIAEIGPGNGALSLPIVKALGDKGRYVGIELSEDMARAAAVTLQAAGAARIDIHTGDCRSAPVEDASLDGLMAINLLYFIDDLPALFGRIAVWLKPQGRAVFGIRSAGALKAMPFTQYGFRVRETEEIEAALRASGLGDVTSTYRDEGTTIFSEMEIPLDSVIIEARAR